MSSESPIESLRPKYDYIFLDTAPNATLPTLAAYMNADYFILSAMPDPFAIAGLNDAVRDIMDARSRGNTQLVLLGVVISAVDKRTSLANSLSDFVEKSFKGGDDAESVKFKTSIGRSTVIPQTQKVGKTLFETHSTHKITDEYRRLAEEIEAAARKDRKQNVADEEREEGSKWLSEQPPTRSLSAASRRRARVALRFPTSVRVLLVPAPRNAHRWPRPRSSRCLA